MGMQKYVLNLHGVVLSLVHYIAETQDYPPLKMTCLLLCRKHWHFLSVCKMISEKCVSFRHEIIIFTLSMVLPVQLHFERCSRTDKGVSAARQLISLKISFYH